MKKLIYSFLFVLCSVFALQAESMVVATYNLRNANAGDSTNGNGWGQRYPYIAQLVQFHGFDIFGTQEGKYHQLQDLKNAMPGYDYIGVGRDDGKQAGEYSAIFYRTGKFEVLDHGDFWLSTITDRPNKGWDAVLPRICTWGKFRDKQTGRRKEHPRNAKTNANGVPGPLFLAESAHDGRGYHRRTAGCS